MTAHLHGHVARRTWGHGDLSPKKNLDTFLLSPAAPVESSLLCPSTLTSVWSSSVVGAARRVTVNTFGFCR